MSSYRPASYQPPASLLPLSTAPRTAPPRGPNRLLRLAIRIGLLATLVVLVGKCSLAVTDRPQFLGLATVHAGASLREATRVVIVLHGYGADRNDLARLTSEVQALGAPEYTAFVYAEGPYRAGLGRAWWATTNPAERADSERRVSELVDDIIATTGLAPDHVYLAGFSQGATLALDVALVRPGTLGGVAAFSPCRDTIPWVERATAHPSVHGVIVHGRADRVCPFDGTSQLQRELATAGHDVRLVELDGPHRLAKEGEQALAALLRGDDRSP